MIYGRPIDDGDEFDSSCLLKVSLPSVWINKPGRELSAIQNRYGMVVKDEKDVENDLSCHEAGSLVLCSLFFRSGAQTRSHLVVLLCFLWYLHTFYCLLLKVILRILNKLTFVTN